MCIHYPYTQDSLRISSLDSPVRLTVLALVINNYWVETVMSWTASWISLHQNLCTTIFFFLLGAVTNYVAHSEPYILFYLQAGPHHYSSSVHYHWFDIRFSD